MKQQTLRIGAIVLLLYLGMGSIAYAQNDKTPMMGWSSWNTFRINISEDLIKASADAMVDKGLKDAGYTFVNVDDGFYGGRDADGTLKIHPTRFPNGMKVVADYIHNKGLKAGIYSEAGRNTCGSQYDGDTNGVNAGFYGYEEQDAKMYFDDWNYDFIKVDFCGGLTQGLSEQTQYTKIWNAIQNTEKAKSGATIRWNICRWMFPGTWAKDVAGSWRISHDIRNNFDETLGVRDVFEHNLYLAAYAGPGHFNDMDMMQIGRNTFSEEEEKSHFGLWCIMNSPLMIGCDLRTIPQSTLNIITNPEVIALNQDVLGLQARVVSRENKQFVVAKMIEQDQGKVRAVALFNGESSAKTMRITFADVQLAGKVVVRDLWNKADVGIFEDYYEVSVPSHATAMLRLEAESSFDKTVFEGEYAYMNEYDATKVDKNTYTGARFSYQFGASGNYVMSGLGKRATNWAEFRDVYSTTGGKYKFKLFYYSGTNRNLTVTVNGKDYLMTNLNSGSDATRGRAFIDEIELQAGYNVIRLSNSSAAAPIVDKFVLLDPSDPGDDNEPDYEVDEEIIVNTDFPAISSEDNSNETWYYIQFRNKYAVLQDMGNGANILTAQKLKNMDEQLWKVTGTSANYYITSKKGRKIYYSSDRFTTSSTMKTKLNIVATTNETYKPAWEIQRRTSAGNAMNQWGGAAFGVELGEWSKGDQNNPLLFIPAPKQTSINPLENPNGTKLKIEDRILEVMGQNIKNVTIYSVTGQLQESKRNPFTFTFRHSGFYIISVIYNDNSTYHKKVIIP